MNPTPNPYFSAEKYSITHFDSSQSDVFPYAVQTGTNTVSPLALPQVINPINLMTLASTSPDYMWAVGVTGIAYVHVSSGLFTPIARLILPGVAQIPQALLLQLLTQPLTSLAQIQSIVNQLGLSGLTKGISSAYSVVDNTNTLFTNYGTKIYAVGLNVAGFPLLGLGVKRTLDCTTFLQTDEGITGLVMTYDGKLAVLGTRSLTIVDRSFSGPVFTATFGNDESISNSAAVDESNGIYVVSDKLMRKVVWTGTALSQNAADGAWVSPYPTGDTYPTAFGSGSGSTPTLMGFGSDTDKLVVITDGLKRMSLLAFWRDQIPSGFTDRIAGEIGVTCGLPLSTEYIQTDQSVAIYNYGAFVVNNVGSGSGTGNFFTDGIARGPILDSPMGVERFEWDPVAHRWSSVWARADVCSNTMVPAISAFSSTVFTNGYYRNAGGWQIRGMDWVTGQTVHSVIFNDNILGNGFYALIQYLPDGDLLLNSILGPVRVQLPGGTVLPL
jgi:hypothetical protein